MQFSEPTFLWLFLPVVLGLYYLVPGRLPPLRNAILFSATLIFTIWAGKHTIFILFAMMAFNYAVAVVLAQRKQRALLITGVAGNLILLAWCKYVAFLNLPLPRIPSPPGLSFVTFVAIAYLVDIYRGDAPAIRNPLDAGQFFIFFSRLFAGPIVRYRDIGNQLATRQHSLAGFADGVRRFVIGLGKKVLIANTVAVPADKIFGLPANELTTPLAWAGIVCYTVQIFFDFAGYTDMAIGLAGMFGFRLPENFNYPYTATSIRDFWRRWHMTLSGWLRDYLYIPLGGSRCSTARVYFNLVVVFVLCGLWHGASWTYVVWGLFQGVFLALERLGLEAALDKTPRPVRHGYALAVTMVSWVVFRAATLPSAMMYLGTLAGINHPTTVTDGLPAVMDRTVWLAVIAGVIGSVPWVSALKTRLVGKEMVSTVALAVVLLVTVLLVAAKTYTPFIYATF